VEVIIFKCKTSGELNGNQISFLEPNDESFVRRQWQSDIVRETWIIKAGFLNQIVCQF